MVVRSPVRLAVDPDFIGLNNTIYSDDDVN